jgi:hypothetical protein
MPLINVPGLHKFGIIKDVEPWDEPWQAWSAGNNVRFDAGRTIRAPVFRTGKLTTGSTLADVAGIFSFRPFSGYDQVFLVDSYGRVNTAGIGTTLTDVSGTGFTPATLNTQFTGTFMGNVFYLNREDGPPRYWLQTGTAFTPIPNMDSPNWTCKIIRSIQSFVVVFNVQKGANTFPTMVKWSDATTAGGPPASWDPTITTNLAGENTLSGASGPITDAQMLRNDMIIYTASQIFQMEPTGDKTYPFTFRKLWDDPKYGSINRNCSIEVDGMHYVFGQNDLYQHDGISAPQSLADGRVKRWVYSNLVGSASKYFFVCHDPFTTTVHFCFQSSDGDAHVPSGSRCNRSADYNYSTNTWGFSDLPNAVGACIATTSAAKTWTSDTGTWGTAGGSWADTSDGYKPALLMAGTSAPGCPQSGYYAVDPLFYNSRVSLPMDPVANWPSYIEHGGVSLSGNGAPLRSFKQVRSLMPTARLFTAGPLTISLGAAEHPADLPNYSTTQTYNPTGQYVIDSRASGRYLAIRIDAPVACDWDITGFDMEIISAGNR